MTTINPLEFEVLMYLKPSLCPNWYAGVKAREAANNIDRPLKDVPYTLEKSGVKGPVNNEAAREMI